MNLSQFMNDEVQCSDLRTLVAEFLVVTEANRIDVFECPVCGEDLRKTYQQLLTPGRGNCNCCKLGIQMVHTVNHVDHPNCSVQITYPVSLADPELIKRLRRAWVHLHGTVLASQQEGIDLERWIGEAKEIMDKYNASRRPQ
jgi:hypothetical protein